MKAFIRTGFIAAFMFLFAAVSAYAAPVITSATINYQTSQITVNGTELVYGTKTSKVVFNGTNYSADKGGTKTAITAQLPSGLAPGTYELKVVNSYGTSANFPVTYGSDGPRGFRGYTGIQGPMGPQGFRGDSGVQGATGPTTIQILSSSQSFSSDGAFIVPQGITNVLVEMWGGGGGGALVSDCAPLPNGGGGGGGYLRATVAVTPGQSIPITVGLGGLLGTGGQDGAPGGDSRFGNLLFAGGGQGGLANGASSVGGTVTGGICSYTGFGSECFGASGLARTLGPNGWLLIPREANAYPGLYDYGFGGLAGCTSGGNTPQAGQPGYVIVSW